MPWSKRRWWRGVSAIVCLTMLLLSAQLLPRPAIAARHANSNPAIGFPPITRAQVIANAKTWVAAGVQYDQHKSYQGYRTDCVGFVSMAWGVAAPGMGNTTTTLQYVTRLSAVDDLQPGDALLNWVGGSDPADWQHIILFAGWVNQSNHSAGYTGYELTPAGAHYDAMVPLKYFNNRPFDEAEYQPVRYRGILDPSQDPHQPSYYADKIVQWNGDTKQQKTSWYVSSDLKRYWIPDSKTFYCLEGEGVIFAGPISSTLLDQLPDQTGQSAKCGVAPASTATAPASAIPTPTSPPHSSGGPDLRQFYVANGAWTAFDVSAATGVSVVADPFEDAHGGIWARDTNNHLRQFYVSNGSWTAFDVSAATGVAIASDVSAGASGEVARGVNGDLYQFYVTSSGAWTAFDVSKATGVAIVGNPFEDSGGGIWARDTNNHLRQFYVSNGKWTAFDVTNATGVPIASDPISGAGGVLARDTNNHLRQFYVAGSSWTAFDVSAATGVSIVGNPYEDTGGGAWARDTNNHLRQFYVSNGAWTAFDVSAATGVLIAGDPNAGASGVFARDTNNHLRQFYVSNGKWTAFDVSAATGVVVAGNPTQGTSGEFSAS